MSPQICWMRRQRFGFAKHLWPCTTYRDRRRDCNNVALLHQQLSRLVTELAHISLRYRLAGAQLRYRPARASACLQETTHTTLATNLSRSGMVAAGRMLRSGDIKLYRISILAGRSRPGPTSCLLLLVARRLSVELRRYSLRREGSGDVDFGGVQN